MATDLQTPYQSTALSVDGGSNGRLTFASTAGFRKGARVFLRDDNTDAVELIIDEIVSATVLTVRLESLLSLYNCSAYTVAQNAMLTQNEQTDMYARTWNWF